MNNLTLEQQTLLSLLRQSLWGESCELSGQIDWKTVDDSAKKQAVVSFLYDGAARMKADVPSEFLSRWRNIMLYGVLNNERLLTAQDEIFLWFSEANIPALVLKGSSVSRYYPQPELRVLGDIDILVKTEDLQRAREILELHGYHCTEAEHDFHIGLHRKGISVELHYSVTGFPKSKGGRIAEKEAACFMDHIAQGAVSQYMFPVLEESHQALSLVMHMIRHMFSEGIGLRQLCDWAMYVAKADPVHFAETTLPMLKRCGLLRYARVATRVCVRYLGLPDEKLSWCADVTDEECCTFIDELFRGGNMGRANGEAMGSLFTDDDIMGTKESALKALISRLNGLANYHYPFTKKYKVFLPLFWVFLPVRYILRSLFGLRPKKSVTKVFASAKKQRRLYEVVLPFRVDNGEG